MHQTTKGIKHHDEGCLLFCFKHADRKKTAQQRALGPSSYMQHHSPFSLGGHRLLERTVASSSSSHHKSRNMSGCLGVARDIHNDNMGICAPMLNETEVTRQDFN
jgi:hypothetical protein